MRRVRVYLFPDRAVKLVGFPREPSVTTRKPIAPEERVEAPLFLPPLTQQFGC